MARWAWRPVRGGKVTLGLQAVASACMEPPGMLKAARRAMEEVVADRDRQCLVRHLRGACP